MPSPFPASAPTVSLESQTAHMPQLATTTTAADVAERSCPGQPGIVIGFSLTPKSVILSWLFLQGVAADSAAKTTEGIS